MWGKSRRRNVKGMGECQKVEIGWSIYDRYFALFAGVLGWPFAAKGLVEWSRGCWVMKYTASIYSVEENMWKCRMEDHAEVREEGWDISDPCDLDLECEQGMRQTRTCAGYIVYPIRNYDNHKSNTRSWGKCVRYEFHTPCHSARKEPLEIISVLWLNLVNKRELILSRTWLYASHSCDAIMQSEMSILQGAVRDYEMSLLFSHL